MSEAQEDQLVKQMAAPIIAEHKQNKKFLRRNREAWLRMNRPEVLEKQERGSKIIFGLLDRFKV